MFSPMRATARTFGNYFNSIFLFFGNKHVSRAILVFFLVAISLLEKKYNTFIISPFSNIAANLCKTEYLFKREK
jgi:hypothetical protein